MNITDFLERHNLKPQHTYLLELIPLIEVMWVDGRNQHKEISIIKEITQRHVSKLNSLVEGITVISEQDAKEFLDRFLHTRPKERLLTVLRELTVDWLKDKGQIHNKGDSIMSYCLDIAAACASTEKFDDRIVQQEKALLKELATNLDIIN